MAMDFQHRAGGKTGGGGVASFSDANRDRRERLRQLALETIDLNKDPYFMKNHLGGYECKLCLTLHNNEGSYLAHTQGKKHQSNLGRRAAKEAKEAPIQPAPEKPRVDIKKFVKIGRPGYKVTKQREPDTGQQSLLFQIDYPEIADGVEPKHRFMSAYEQKVEPPDKKWQYVLFAAEPYETISFKVPSREVDKSEGKFWTLWNKDTKQFFLQFAFRLVDTQQPPAPDDDDSMHPQNRIIQPQINAEPMAPGAMSRQPHPGARMPSGVPAPQRPPPGMVPPPSATMQNRPGGMQRHPMPPPPPGYHGPSAGGVPPPTGGGYSGNPSGGGPPRHPGGSVPPPPPGYGGRSGPGGGGMRPGPVPPPPGMMRGSGPHSAQPRGPSGYNPGGYNRGGPPGMVPPPPPPQQQQRPQLQQQHPSGVPPPPPPPSSTGNQMRFGGVPPPV